MDDIQIAKKELKGLFKEFIDDPDNLLIQRKAIDLERKYASLATINDYTKDKIVPDSLIKAISFLQKIYQYDDGIFEKNKTLNDIKEFEKNF